jgi:hypothetical protein
MLVHAADEANSGVQLASRNAACNTVRPIIMATLGWRQNGTMVADFAVMKPAPALFQVPPRKKSAAA